LVETKLHRVAVMNVSKTKIIKMLTQSTIINYINNCNFKELDKPLSDFFKRKPVLSILESKSALDAFDFIQQNNVYGVAIVDYEGKITGNVSVSDLKYAATCIDKIHVPLTEYWHDYPKHYSCVKTVTFQDTLKQLISLFATEKVHRFYIVEDSKPVGVISKTDVIEVFASLLPANNP